MTEFNADDQKSIKVALITDDISLKNKLEGLLNERPSLQYKVAHATSISDCEKGCDVAILDEGIIDSNPTKNLAKFSFEIHPTPIIYVTEEIKSQEGFQSVKSLAADYLLKDRLSARVLNNTVRWVIENQRLKLELEQQNNRYQSLFYNAVDPAFILDEKFNLETANEAFQRDFDISSHKINETNFEDILLEKEGFLKEVERLNNGAINHIDQELNFAKLGDSEPFRCHLKLSMLRKISQTEYGIERQIEGYHGTVSNISYREKLRESRAKTEKIETTYRLARTLAHEIRNPLTNINLALEQLYDNQKCDEEIKLYLEMIGRSGDRINHLIGRLLNSSKSLEIDRSNCDVIELIVEAIEAVKDRAELAAVEIIKDFEIDKFEYECDGEMITAAISNLLVNAIEAMDKTEKTIEVAFFQDDEELQISVSDNGKGMDSNELQKLFDPFYTGKDEGLGLGLTDVQNIIHEHNGEIKAESEKGNGSKFTITLPILTQPTS